MMRGRSTYDGDAYTDYHVNNGDDDDDDGDNDDS